MNKILYWMQKNWYKFKQACANLQEFQERIWIVSIQKNSGIQNSLLNDTFLVSEDSFDHPMQWMEKQGYQVEMIKNVDNMKRSQAIQIQLENSHHSLIRVK